MNILFVNYGNFTTNSLNHIAGFANALSALGHSCIVAVPKQKETLDKILSVSFKAALFEDILKDPRIFNDGRPADLIHAWTPREVVRKFVLAHQRISTARLIVHLEDNEEFLLEKQTGHPIEDLRTWSDEKFAFLDDSLSHPVRYKNFLRSADGVTKIVESLDQFIPSGQVSHLLPPGVDFSLYRPQPADLSLRQKLGLEQNEKVIVFTGSSTFANAPEMCDLYRAVHLLNKRGIRVKLVRTGFNPPELLEELDFDFKSFTVDLGFVDKASLPRLLALADVLVQPGRAGPFNDYRLPSKLPEFFAVGRPVILPATNVGKIVKDGHDALLLKSGTPQEIANRCAQIFENPELASRLGKNAESVAKAYFDLTINSNNLNDFYLSVIDRQPSPWKVVSGNHASEFSVLHALLQRDIEALPELPAEFSELKYRVISLTKELASSAFRLDVISSDIRLPLDELRAAHEKQRAEWEASLEETRNHVKNIENALILTRQHADNIEKTISQLRQHADNVEGTLGQLRKDQARQETSRIQAETLLRAVRQQAFAFEAELQRSEASRIQTERELLHTRQQLEAARATAKALENRLGNEVVQLRDKTNQLDDKVRRMQTSFSWQATSWLRTLRRLVVDPFQKQKSPEPTAAPTQTPALVTPSFGHEIPALTPAGPAFHFTVDYPISWQFGPRKVFVRGWCFAKDTTVLKEIRAIVDSQIYPGTYGLKRLDVLAALRDFPQAEYCGFKIEIALEVGDKEISLEIGDENGAFHRFFSHGLSVTENGSVDELTSYEKWVEVFDRHSPEQLKALAVSAEAFPFRPLISIVVPVYNTPERWLSKAIDSVRAQVYSNWELCIADDASTEPHIRPFLEKVQREDSRIKAIFREKNGHISAASNSALEITTGEFIALLDHDDEIPPHALYEVVSALNTRPETDLVYSDEDKIDEEGRRHAPYFKPDFLPDLFHGQNYTSHLSVYRTKLVKEIGGFRIGYEGSQDWDLALRFIEKTRPERILHIPKVLYHWRAIPGSTALLISEKNYPVEAARRALTDHFSRIGTKVELIHVPGDHWRVKYPLPEKPPLVSLIIPTRNRLAILRQCVESILAKTSYPRFEIIVVDNESDDQETLLYFADLKKRGVQVLEYHEPFNYSAINNFAVSRASGEIIGLINNDLEVIHGDWLSEMVSQAIRPGIGAVGAMLYYPNNTIQHAGVIVGLGGVAGHAFRDFPRGTEGVFNRARLIQNYSAVTAACLIIRKSIFQEVGGLDAENLSVAFNDIDFCLKVKTSGYLNLWTPFAELYHHESASRGADDTPEKHERFAKEVDYMLKRWGDRLKHDPAYNPNLTLEFTDFSLAAPPRIWRL